MLDFREMSHDCTKQSYNVNEYNFLHLPYLYHHLCPCTCFPTAALKKTPLGYFKKDIKQVRKSLISS